MNDVAANLADNLRRLREARAATQQRLSDIAGIPRATLANLESGGANPTLSVLVKVAAALQVSVEELIGPPRDTGQLYRVDALRSRTRGDVTVRKLLPESLRGLDVERMELPGGKHLTGVPHTPGTREYLTCERGEVQLTASGTTWTLTPGDVVVFRGDQKHSYRNPGREVAVAYSVVAFAPSGG